LLCQTLQILRDNARIVFLFQTISGPLDLLRSLLSGLGVRHLSGNLVEMQIMLKDLLDEQYRAGKKVVLIIDEAQNLDDSMLELVRMLSNFETEREKLIQIVLAGQPQLANNIGSPALVQLRQRVSKLARLQPFTPEETARYIAHRLQIAGYASDMPLFTKDALALIALCSEGIPRNINNLCFNALSLGCALQQKPIDRNMIRQVIADLDLGPMRRKFSLPPPPEEGAAAKTALIVSSANAPSVFQEWRPKIAIAAVVLLAVSAILFTSRQWLPRSAAQPPVPASAAQPAVTSEAPTMGAPEPPATVSSVDPPEMAAPMEPPAFVQTNTPKSPAVPAAWTFLIAHRTPQLADSVGIVSVTPGQTLLGICAEKFGNCTAQLLQQIHELNPSLSDPDHIKSGQKIRIPVLAAQSATVDPRRAPSYDKSTHE
jgi:hypothetical protein